MAKRPKQGSKQSAKTSRDLVLEEEELSSWFEIRRDELAAKNKSIPNAATFSALGMGAGTHLVKLISARAELAQSVLRARPPGANEMPPFYASVDVKVFAPAGIVFDKIRVRNHPERRLVDHLTSPDELSPKVCKAFAVVFGQKALDALQTATNGDAQPITRLPAAEFPIIFVPRPDHSDLQITPLAPAGAHVNFHQVTAPFFDDVEEGQPFPRRGRWARQALSGKSQNIGYAIPAIRRRFRADMPGVLKREAAELHAYLKGGPFPRWRDAAVSDAVLRYDDLLERAKTYSNADIRAGLNARADALIHGARAFRAEVLAEAALKREAVETRTPPAEADLILRRYWKGDDRARARRAIASDHFRGRVERMR